MPIGEGDQSIARGYEERVGAQEERARPLRDKVRKGRLDLSRVACI
jgi:hypothetical protein